MRTIQKVAFSLLIAIVLFAVFAVLAFSGLFDVIESRFYNRRITSTIENDVLTAQSTIDKYTVQNLKRFSTVLQLESIQRSYLPNRSKEDIFNSDNAVMKLKGEVPGFLFTRFIDEQGNIHFSTFENDIKKRTDFSLIYDKLDNVDPVIPFTELLIREGGNPDIYIDGKGNRILFRLPFYDNVGLYKGTALFYVGVNGLRDYLIRSDVLIEGSSFLLLDKKGYIFNSGDFSADFVIGEILPRLNEAQAGEEIINIPLAEDNSGQKYFLFFVYSPDSGYICSIVDESFFSLNNSLRYILLASFFLTIFLIMFLVFNFRQDKLVVLSERVKRFQINFLKGYIEKKDEVDWEQWKLDLARKREKLKKEIKSGVGKLEGKAGEEVDTLIEKSWDEIIGVIGKRADEEVPRQLDVSNRIEIENLEKIFEKVLTSGRIVLPTRATEIVQVSQPLTTGDVEELEEVEAVEGIEELEEMEPAEGIEELAGKEADEEGDDLDEVQDFGEVEEDQLSEAETEEGIDLFETIIEDDHEAELTPEPEDLEELEQVAPFVPEPPQPQQQESLEVLVPADENEKEALLEAASLEDVTGAYTPFSLFGQSHSSTTNRAEVWKNIVRDEPGELLEIEIPTAEETGKEQALPAQVSMEDAKREEAMVEELLPEEEPLVESMEEEAETAETVQGKSIPSVSSDFMSVIDSLIRENKIEIKTIPEMFTLYEGRPEVIGIENGVYKIKEEVFSSASKAPDKGLQELVKEVVGVEDEDRYSGIDHIFSGSGIDLPFFNEGKDKKEEIRPVVISKPVDMHTFNEHGFNFDAFTSRISRGRSGDLRAIKKISKELEAIIAAVLTLEDGAFRVHFSLGMDSESQELSTFSCNRDFTKYFLLDEKFLLMKGLFSDVESIKISFSNNDTAYIRGVAFLPLWYNSKPAYIFLGLKKEDTSIAEIVTKLFELSI